jgi:hypothetical protein
VVSFSKETENFRKNENFAQTFAKPKTFYENKFSRNEMSRKFANFHLIFAFHKNEKKTFSFQPECKPRFNLNANLVSAATSLEYKHVVFRNPWCSATEKSGVHCVENIVKIVWFLPNEYYDRNITCCQHFVHYLPPISL